jgi:hypothetical protein
MRATEFITESLDKPYPWRQARAKYSMAKYVFRANSILKRYQISFDVRGDNRVEIGFGRYTLTRGLDLGKTKDSYREAQRIFATVGAVIMDFLKNNPSVNTIHFSAPAEEGEIEQTSSRIRLYGALAKRLQRQFGWPHMTRDTTEIHPHSNAPVVYWDISKDAEKVEPTQDRDYAAAQAAKNPNPILDKIYPMRKAQAVDRVLSKGL